MSVSKRLKLQNYQLAFCIEGSIESSLLQAIEQKDTWCSTLHWNQDNKQTAKNAINLDTTQNSNSNF